jgi:hypothetical protein
MYFTAPPAPRQNADRLHALASCIDKWALTSCGQVDCAEKGADQVFADYKFGMMLA